MLSPIYGKVRFLCLWILCELVINFLFRFCGLVFRGPLSVQEDWIKHLQRHIVNANLPRTGAGMVEVTSLLKKPASITETSFSLLMAEAAS